MKNQPDAKHLEPYLLSYRWLMLTLLWLLYFSFGTVAGSAAPLITPMLRDLHMSYGRMGFVLGSWQVTYIAVAVVAGIVLDKWGVRRSLFVGTIVIALSAGLRYFATGFWTLVAFVALFGLGGPMISVGAPKTISVWFRGKDRGTAVGIYSAAPRVGRMSVLAATNGIVMPLTGYSWRLTFLCYGLLTLGVALFWWTLARDAEKVDVAKDVAAQQVLVSLIKVGNVRLLLMAGILSYSISHGFLNWLPKILENGGMSPTVAGLAAATPLLVSIPGVIIIPRLVPPHVRAWSIGVSALFAALATMLVASSGFPPVAGLLLFGITGPLVTPLLILTLMEIPEVGSRHMGSAGGMFFCVAEIGGFVGPFMVGYLFDLTGTFLAATWFMVLLGLVIFSLMFVLKMD